MSIHPTSRGSLTRRIANVAVIAIIGAVVAASALDHLTRDGGTSLIAFLLPEDPAGAARGTSPHRTGLANLDMTPTGSVGRPIILSPCTGQEK